MNNCIHVSGRVELATDIGIGCTAIVADVGTGSMCYIPSMLEQISTGCTTVGIAQQLIMRFE